MASVIITDELIEAGKSAAGGWTKKQLRLIGQKWPPPLEWKNKVIGRKVDKRKADEFVALKDNYRIVSYRERN